MADVGPATIRALRAEDPKTRARDFAANHGITEAELVAAHLGHGATAISADPDRLIPWVGRLGDVMALTRNDHCVHERHGHYSDYRSSRFAAMVLDPEIDLRIFLAHWVHAFAVTEVDRAGGARSSIQVFDAAGDAVHKVFLKPGSNQTDFADLVAALRLHDPPATLSLSARRAVAPARTDPDQAAAMRDRWNRMSDTHQFLKMARDHGMNRLGAYRVAGMPYTWPLATDAVVQSLEEAAARQIPVMIFVGNMGCIQIHGGPIGRPVTMGPWFNIMDPRFNLHLRTDRIAEVWAVWKPTRTGDIFSVEGFAADGELILQVFAYRKDTPSAPWDALVAELPRLDLVPA